MRSRLIAATIPEREPHRIAVDYPAPIVHVHEPRPLIVTDRNCGPVAGLTPRAWRKVARAMVASGLPVTTTSDGLTAATADVERWLAQHAPPVEVEPRKAVAPVEDTDDSQLLAKAGVVLRAVGGRK